MRITRVRLENIYQHRFLDIAITGSRVALIGDNGGGKSNFLLSIGECLHGEFHQNKDRIVTWGEKTGEMFVEFLLSNNRRIEVSRKFPSGNAEMKIYGPDGVVEVVSGPSKVNERILTELETDKGVLQNIVFVGQKDIESVLFARESDKARLAQKFFGLQLANTLERTITKCLGDVITDSYADHLPALVERRGVVSAEVDALEKSLDSKPRLEEIDKKIRELDLRISSASALNTRLASYQAAVKNLESERAANADLCKRYEADYAQLQSIDIETAKRKAERQSKVMELKERCRQLFAKESSILAKITSLGQRPCDDNRIASLEEIVASRLAVITALKGERASKAQLLDSISSTPTCPTCGQSIDISGRAPLESAIQALEREIEEKNADYRNRFAELSGMKAECLKWDNEMRDARTNQAAIAADLAQSKKALDEIDPCDAENPDPAKWIAIVEEHGRLSNKLINDYSVIQSSSKRVESNTALVKSLESDVVKDGVVAKEVSVSELQVELEKHRRELMDVHSATTLLASKRTAKSECEGQIIKAREAQAKNAASEEIRHTLSIVRAAFHPDGAPKTLVDRGTKSLEGRINHYLSILKAKFRITARDGLNFNCHFDSGTAFDTELSVGQKVALSWAFRLAACETFGSSVGLMTMDEPTATLDKSTNEAFLEVMDAMNDLAEKFSMQFFVATHSESLAKACDQIIKVNAPVD